MKVSAILLCIGTFTLFAENVHSQSSRVTISRTNALIETVLNDIESQTDYLFIYKKNVPVHKRTDIDVINAEVSDVLDELFVDTKVQYTLSGNYIFLSKSDRPAPAPQEVPVAAAQDRRPVVGIVRDESGEPLVGVAILLKGTKTGAITDIDGSFSIQADEGSILEISSIGYKTVEVAARIGSPLNIILEEDSEMLEETVVIGYGVQRKSDVTGSVASVKSSDLSNRSTSDAASALQGKAAGVQIINTSGAPGSETQIRVRGFSSNSGNIGPLLIVDGLQVNSIQYLDPSMIQSIEILKDAASASIYGAQAGNGVVLITTKTGSAENGNSYMTYDFKLTRQSLAHKPELFNAKDWIAYKEASGYDMQAMLLQNGYDGTDTDWFDALFAPSFTPQHAFTFQGGTSRSHFFTSLNYVNNDGIVKGDRDQYKRLSAQINADYKVNDWITVGANTSLEKSSSKSVSQQGRNGNFMNSVMTLDPLTPVYYSDPSQFSTTMYQAYLQGKTILTDPETGLYYATSKYIEDDSGNPFVQMYKTDASTDQYNVRGTLYANLTFLKNIVYTSRFGYRISHSNTHSFGIPYYANKQANSDNYSISASANTGFYYQWENFVNYNKTFGKHSIGAMAGMSYIENNSDNVNGNASGPDILTGYDKNFQYLDYVNSASTTTKAFGNAPSRSSNISYYGRLTYNYNNRYNLQANFRADAFDSSKLSRQSRWGYFPSVSAGWTISNEPFFRDNVDRSAITFLKLRASWGQNGNVNVLNNYQYSTSINYNGALYQYQIDDGAISYGSAPSGLANPNLKWETSEQIDLGLDARFLNDRLTLGLDWYQKNTKDLLVSISPVPEIGVSSTYVNAGSVLNKGLELELRWSDQIGDFGYSISGNLSKLKNKVTYLDPSIYRLETATYSYNNRMRTAFEVGYPIWYFRAYNYLGVDENGAPVIEDVNGDGQIGDADRTFVGGGIPDYTFGLTINMDWKGFDFTLYGAGTAGNEIFNLFYQADLNMRNSLRYFYDNAWTPNNKSAKMPSCQSVATDWTFWSSSAAMFDGSFFKIKQIQLGYTFPERLLSKVSIKGLRIFVSADDMLCFTKYPGCDPESATSSSANSMGLDNGGYPVTSKLITGVNIKF